MPLSGQAKTDYQRDYMARRRAAERRERDEHANTLAKRARKRAKTGSRRSPKQTEGNRYDHPER